MDKKELEKIALIVTGKMVLDTPNDMELGEKIRQMLYEAGKPVIYENKKEKK